MVDDNLNEILGFDPDSEPVNTSTIGEFETMGIPKDVQTAFEEVVKKRFALKKVYAISSENLFYSSKYGGNYKGGVEIPGYERVYKRYFYDDEQNILFEDEKTIHFGTSGPEEKFYRWHHITI